LRARSPVAPRAGDDRCDPTTTLRPPELLGICLGLVSDTHDDIAAAQVASERIATVAHLGDVVAPFTPAPFEEFSLHHIRGNNEAETALWRAVDGLDNGTHHADAVALDVGGRSIPGADDAVEL
jgi:hypothetical protein